MNIRTVTEGGLKWVRSTTDVFAVFPIPLEAYRTVLMDVQAYPGYVPHLKSVDLFTTPSGVRAMRQHFEVRILGFVFASVFAMTIEPDDSHLPGRWRTYWNFVDSDGTIGAAAGYWELVDVSEGGESRVLVRNVNDGTVRKKIPFQTGIMRRVAEREMAASLLNGYHEALRRWPHLAGSAKAGAAVENLPSYRADDGSRD